MFETGMFERPRLAIRRSLNAELGLLPPLIIKIFLLHSTALQYSSSMIIWGRFLKIFPIWTRNIKRLKN